MAIVVSTSVVTADQVRELWERGGRIERHGMAAITQDDLGVLDVDTDDDGRPFDNQWQVIADQLNTELHEAEAKQLVAALDIPGGPKFGEAHQASDLPGWSRVGQNVDFGRIPDMGDREYRAPSGTVYTTHAHDPQRPAKTASHIRVVVVLDDLGGPVDVCYSVA